MNLRGAAVIGGAGSSLRVAPSKKLNDCLLQGRTCGICPWISRLDSFSKIVRDDVSEPTVTTANLQINKKNANQFVV